MTVLSRRALKAYRVLTEENKRLKSDWPNELLAKSAYAC